MAKLIAIDESNRDQHAYLRQDDRCYFFHEYTAGQGFSFSSTNSLISNLKKKPSGSAKPGYHYKAEAVRQCAKLFRDGLNPRWLEGATLVPVPGSKVTGHPDFDDRIERICRGIRPQPATDVRCLVQQRDSTEAFHAGQRLRPADLVRLYEIDETLCAPVPTSIGIVDDVLTAGTHFRAMHTVLSARFPGVPITGLFVARRALPPSVDLDFDDWLE